MKTVENIYGKAAAMRLRTEKAIMEKYTVRNKLRALEYTYGGNDWILMRCTWWRPQRMPGLPSSRVGLDTITGKDEEMEFSDIFSGKKLLLDGFANVPTDSNN